MKKSKNKNREKDIEFYTEIWNASDKRCKISGKYLGKEPLTTFFHHILPKTRFPEFRWCKWNILLVHPEVHAQIEIDIDRVPEARKLYDELTKLYENGNLSNC